MKRKRGRGFYKEGVRECVCVVTVEGKTKWFKSAPKKEIDAIKTRKTESKSAYLDYPNEISQILTKTFGITTKREISWC